MLAAAVSLTVGLSLMSITALATATGTTSDNVNVRSTASTSGSIVGTISPGQSVEVTGEEQDASGQTWYAVTLSNGQTGFVRGDLISVSGTYGEEEAPVEETPAADPTPAEGGDDAQTAAPAAQQSSEQYQLVYTPDPQTGENTWYLYFTEDGTRMKVSEIQSLAEELEKAENSQNDSAKRFRLLMIIFLILFLLAAGACVLLFLRLRDAMSGEVDLARDRNRERKVNRNADAVTIRRSEGQRASRERSDAYPAGERRTGTGAARTASDRSGAQGQVRRSTQDGQPVRRTAEGARDQRTVRPDAARRTADGTVRRPVERTAGAEQRESGARRAPSQAQGTAREAGARQAVRPEARDGVQREGVSRPSARPEGTVRSTDEQPRRQAPARNFVEPEDDSEYGFLGSNN